MNQDMEIQLNRHGFYALAHVQLLTKMLKVAGYRTGTTEFNRLLKQAVDEMGQENTEKYLQFAAMVKDLPQGEPTAMGATIAGGEGDERR